jgi:quinoprotein glucose dehydrogenase
LGSGANWWGGSFDPDTNTIFIPSIMSPIVVKLVKPDPARSNFNYVRGGGGLGGGADGPKGLPLFKPPYGRITRSISIRASISGWCQTAMDLVRRSMRS